MSDCGVTSSFIKEFCVFRSSADRTYKNSAGKRMQWILDLRLAMLDGRILHEVANQFWDMFGDIDCQLAGIEMAGIPLVSAIALEGHRRGKDVSALIVRVKRKKHMAAEIIEGAPSGKPILLIDDALNSGRNAELARKKLEAIGLKVAGLFCIVDFRSNAGIHWRVNNKVEVTSLLDLGSLNLQYSRSHAPLADYEIKWSFAAPNPKLDFAVAKSTPVIFEDKIIFGSDSGIVWGVEKNTGRICWQFKTNDRTGKGVLSSPVVRNGNVYFGSYDGGLYCLDAKTGRQVWASMCCNWIGSSPAVHGDKIYVGLEYRNSTQGGKIACFDLKGQILWTKPTVKPLHSSPIIHSHGGNDYLITGTNDCDLFALDPTTGDVISHFKTGGPTKYHCAAWGNRAVACAFDAIYVWNYLTGDVLLKLETEDINYSRPLVVGDIAFCGSADGNLYMINMRSCELVGQIDVEEKIHSSPALIDGLVWVGTSAGELIAIDPINFEMMYRFAFPERITCTPVSDGNLIFVYTYDNRIWAISKK